MIPTRDRSWALGGELLRRQPAAFPCLQKGIRYALNQCEALCRFLTDGRLPIHNTFSERELRREAVGHKNWFSEGTRFTEPLSKRGCLGLASLFRYSGPIVEFNPRGYPRDAGRRLPSRCIKSLTRKPFR
ncbi:MAG: IS66 family transposase [Deltaproteobacteria bacterium]